MIVTNYKGKAILDSLRDLKVKYDADFCKRQTFQDFEQDPLGVKILDEWALSDPKVIQNVMEQKIIN